MSVLGWHGSKYQPLQFAEQPAAPITGLTFQRASLAPAAEALRLSQQLCLYVKGL
jgi:hypothetical protein